jgi:hypothetical protein
VARVLAERQAGRLPSRDESLGTQPTRLGPLRRLAVRSAPSAAREAAKPKLESLEASVFFVVGRRSRCAQPSIRRSANQGIRPILY